MKWILIGAVLMVVLPFAVILAIAAFGWLVRQSGLSSDVVTLIGSIFVLSICGGWLGMIYGETRGE